MKVNCWISSSSSWVLCFGFKDDGVCKIPSSFSSLSSLVCVCAKREGRTSEYIRLYIRFQHGPYIRWLQIAEILTFLVVVATDVLQSSCNCNNNNNFYRVGFWVFWVKR